MSEETEFVDPDDLKVERDGDGDLMPEDREVEGLGKIKLVPMRYGDVQDYFGDGAEADVGPEDLAAIFNEFYIYPDFDLDSEGVADFKPMVPAVLLQELMDASGIDADVDVDEQGEATVAVGNT